MAQGGRGLCLPKEYQKFDLPSPNKTTFVTIGINLKDIPKISDQDFSITIDTYFNVRWRDERLLTQMEPKTQELSSGGEEGLTAVNLNVLPNLWIPDIEILDLMSFETHKVLSRLEGVWIDNSGEVLYAMASKITFICQMNFNAFPVDIQVCHFRVGSFNYPYKKITFINEGIPRAEDIKSVLDYQVEFNPLPKAKSSYIALGMNYSAAGFELVLTRKMSFYIITYYLPSGLFVVVSWISFLVNPEVVPGRMTMLVTLFLVLINIHNTIQTNSPKAEGFTAIKTWIIACIVFVFGALLEYSVILFLLKLEKIKSTYISMKGQSGCPNGGGVAVAGGGGGAPPEAKVTLWTKGSMRLEGNVARRKGTANHRFTRLDVSFFVLFPILFIMFNAIYWSSVMYWRWKINTDVLRIEH